MAYTPELSYQSSCTLRRIAWALEKPMTKTIEEIFDYLPMIINKSVVCRKCRDQTKCNNCGFKQEDLKTVKNATNKFAAIIH